MDPTESLIALNQRLLLQAERVLLELDDALYARVIEGVGEAAIGGHVRHLLDTYTCLFAGLEDGRVDFDRRERDARLETDRQHALSALRAAAERLEGLRRAAGSRPLLVKAERGPGAAEPERWSVSSLARELHATASHTVHHFALIAVFLRLLGRTPPEGFGVAPSTLRYWEESRACVR